MDPENTIHEEIETEETETEEFLTPNPGNPEELLKYLYVKTRKVTKKYYTKKQRKTKRKQQKNSRRNNRRK